MQKKIKKERSLSSQLPPTLTPFTELKVGETFIVLRRSPNNATDERCIATIVDIREEGLESSSRECQVCFFLVLLFIFHLIMHSYSYL